MINPNNLVVCTFYHFVTLDDCRSLKSKLLKQLELHGIRGTLLLAVEGINGTIAGPKDGIDSFIGFLKSDARFADLRCKESTTSDIPFHRTSVKLKTEIVSMGVPEINPTLINGTYVKPEDWNALITDPDVTVIDVRNEYEVQIGSFRNTLNPHTQSFREFPEFAKQKLDPASHRKIAMFCTGGIRCEKSTAWMKSAGFDEVYHLEGGILQYLAEIPEEESLWEGECFVFDKRVTVDHKLRQGRYDQCHACRMPITNIDKTSEDYVPGISCPHCIDQLTEKRRMRFCEREKQVKLARDRGVPHLGDGAAEAQSAAAQSKKNRQRIMMDKDRLV